MDVKKSLKESPIHSIPGESTHDFFNMSLGYRHDSPASSPYGYTVKVAHRNDPTSPKAMEVSLSYTAEKFITVDDASQIMIQLLRFLLPNIIEIVNMRIVNGKTEGAVWFVSNCVTHSKRMDYVTELKKYFPVDIYGTCGTLYCKHGGQCEKMLDYVYHFYLAFENSICKDYVTEKLWKHGFQHDIVPIVLKRSIVEHLVPPHSFIAADDFDSPGAMAAYLNYLIQNRTAYIEFFSWRQQYKVVFLEGNYHDTLERPWGVCQVFFNFSFCVFSDKTYFEKWWSNSCEEEGDLVSRLVGYNNGSLPRKTQSLRSRYP
ncbi:fucosyl transferase [Dictyocaulus viviparus]|uniref:Fucosyltransferase n=1 Tax=Dictyocaulus viviparus TaxID=29172 RepID=A0A0D8YDC8_DICVI|nr:fucosyl transferase [Dictyocaulus viviparus]